MSTIPFRVPVERADLGCRPRSQAEEVEIQKDLMHKTNRQLKNAGLPRFSTLVKRLAHFFAMAQRRTSWPAAARLAMTREVRQPAPDKGLRRCLQRKNPNLNYIQPHDPAAQRSS